MSDEDTEPTWYPPELRDHRAAFVAQYGFLTCNVCMVLSLPATLAASGGGPPAVFGILAGTAAAAVITAVVLTCSTRYRALGLLPPAAAAAVVGSGLNLFADAGAWLELLLIWSGTLGGALPAARFVPAKAVPGATQTPRTEGLRTAHARYAAVFGGAALVAGVGLTAALAVAGFAPTAADPLQRVMRWYFFAVAALLCVWCWLRLFRPFVELCLEPVFRVPYRMRASGPGVRAVPPLGPVLVIANHASWFDPCFLAEFIPRPITPMMTSRFFDKWFLRPLLKHVFRVIVVPDATVRREAPELQLAIDALTRGECVVIFPEGYLQRKAEVPLRRFGQGVWHILSARPHTPVVACWIDGAWGSQFSYLNGPPGANKRMDFRRPIRVGVSEPEVVPADVLADQMATRVHLMNRVGAARAHLGLPPHPPFELPPAGVAETESAQPEPSS
jgi:1-acyl-sn-glycerol-3-phosphate acyltransferase